MILDFSKGKQSPLAVLVFIGLDDVCVCQFITLLFTCCGLIFSSPKPPQYRADIVNTHDIFFRVYMVEIICVYFDLPYFTVYLCLWNAISHHPGSVVDSKH